MVVNILSQVVNKLPSIVTYLGFKLHLLWLGFPEKVSCQILDPRFLQDNPFEGGAIYFLYGQKIVSFITSVTAERTLELAILQAEQEVKKENQPYQELWEYKVRHLMGELQGPDRVKQLITATFKDDFTGLKITQGEASVLLEVLTPDFFQSETLSVSKIQSEQHSDSLTLDSVKALFGTARCYDPILTTLHANKGNTFSYQKGGSPHPKLHENLPPETRLAESTVKNYCGQIKTILRDKLGDVCPIRIDKGIAVWVVE